MCWELQDCLESRRWREKFGGEEIKGGGEGKREKDMLGSQKVGLQGVKVKSKLKLMFSLNDGAIKNSS